MFMRTHGEGPIMGLKEGWISMGDFVRTPVQVSMIPPDLLTSTHTILYNLCDEHSNLNER